MSVGATESENLVTLRHGLTAESDHIGKEPSVHIKGLDALNQPIILKLDAAQVKMLMFLIELAPERNE